MKKLLLPSVLALVGMTGCESTGTAGSGVCAGLSGPVAALEVALLNHPETSDPVGEAGADVVVGFDAGC